MNTELFYWIAGFMAGWFYLPFGKYLTKMCNISHKFTDREMYH